MAEEKIKVFHVLTDRNIGGAGRWLLYYIKYHNKEKFDLWVVLPQDSTLYPAVVETGVAVIPMTEMEDRSFDKKAKKALKALFRAEKPQVVHTHASLTARMAAKEAKVPLIINTKHCMEGSAGSLPKKLIRRGINRCFSHKIIAVSKAVRRSMIAGGTSPKQIATIYNGIDTILPLSLEEKKETLAVYGGNSDKKAVGIVARLEEVKDHDTFLRGAQMVLQNREDVCFYIIGDGSRKAELEEKAVSMGIFEDVIFTGFVKDVERLAAALDLAVITSKEEALCLSILESMRVGIPAIGTDTGGISEVIRHGENGYLIAVGDEQALAQRIEELLSNEETCLKMGEHAAHWVKEHFTARDMAARIEALYLEERR